MPIPEKYLAKFETGKYYHIFNRSIGNRVLFKEERNYHYFLELLQSHLREVIKVHAYCLIPNHFHLFVKIGLAGDDIHSVVSNKFRSFFIAYTNGINKAYNER